MGSILIVPYGRHLSEFLSVCSYDATRGQPWGAVCSGIGLAEVILGGSLLAGLLVRVTGWLAVADFSVRAAAGFAASFARDGSTVAGIEPYGDWAWGAAYLGTVMLLYDIVGVGGGKLSVDRFIYERLHRGLKQHP